MANPFREAMSGSQKPQGGPMNMMQAFQQFKQNFQGDPIEQLQSKLNSGEMSQQQYNQLRGMAESIAQRMMGVLPRR